MVERRRRQYRAAYAGMVARDHDRVRRAEAGRKSAPEYRRQHADREAARRASDRDRINERNRESAAARRSDQEYADARRRYQRDYHQNRMTDGQREARRANRLAAQRARMDRIRADPAAHTAYLEAAREWRRRRRLRILTEIEND